MVTSLNGYEGVIRGAVVVLKEKSELPEGTPVLVLPQVDMEDQWLTIHRAARIFALPNAQLERWVQSGKVRANSERPELINAGDVEDAVEQRDLFSLTMACADKEA